MKKLFIIFFSCIVISASSAQGYINADVTVEETDQTILKKIENWYKENMNYATITVLMVIESSFIPFPSEIVVPPAAYIASQPDSNMNIPFVILFATIGAVIGALINYYLAVYLGRPLVYKFADSKLGHVLLLSKEKILKAEIYFNSRGKISTFIGRLIPGIRQLISIPAGLARMNLASFLFYTTLGAGLWNIILALLGYIAHGQQELIDKYSHELSYVLLGLVVLFITYIVLSQAIKANKRKRDLNTEKLN